MSEHHEACAFINWRDIVAPQYPALRRLFHVPNGGQRGAVVGAKLKAEGTQPGVADYLWLLPCGVWHGMCLELKDRRGRLRPDQADWLKWHADQGYWCVVAYGAGAAAQAVCTYINRMDLLGTMELLPWERWHTIQLEGTP